MTALISITNVHSNELQFDISVKGTDVKDMHVRFVVEYHGVWFVYECKQGDEAAKWVVTIPTPSYIESGSYDFHIEIVTNGYYFKPYSGKVHVSSEPSVSLASTATPPQPVVTDITNIVATTMNSGVDKRRVVEDVVKTKSLPKTKTKPKTTPKAKPKNPITEKNSNAIKSVMDTLAAVPEKPQHKTTQKVAPINLDLSNPTHTKRKAQPNIVATNEDTDTNDNGSRLASIIEDIRRPSEQTSKVRDILAEIARDA